MIEGVRRIHEAYAFPADAYAFVGLDAETLHAAGVLPERADRAAPRSAPHRDSARSPPRRGLTRAARRG